MVRDRGYTGSVVQLRRLVARLRPVQKEAFLRLVVSGDRPKRTGPISVKCRWVVPVGVCPAF